MGDFDCLTMCNRAFIVANLRMHNWSMLNDVQQYDAVGIVFVLCKKFSRDLLKSRIKVVICGNVKVEL